MPLSVPFPFPYLFLPFVFLSLLSSKFLSLKHLSFLLSPSPSKFFPSSPPANIRPFPYPFFPFAFLSLFTSTNSPLLNLFHILNLPPPLLAVPSSRSATYPFFLIFLSFSITTKSLTLSLYLKPLPLPQFPTRKFFPCQSFYLPFLSPSLPPPPPLATVSQLIRASSRAPQASPFRRDQHPNASIRPKDGALICFHTLPPTLPPPSP